MKPRINPFRKFASAHARLLQRGKKLPACRPQQFQHQPQAPADRVPKVLIFSPHPDDECIIGGLALRLLREAKWNVINVAVTLGSQRERQTARRRELECACAQLGFSLLLHGKRGLERISLETRKQNRAHWNAAVTIMAKHLAEHRPRVIFLPHENDGHPAHVGTHFLILDALKALPADFECQVVETEFWRPMADANLLVELDVEDVGDLVAALACHVGEVRRNAYHARLPAWMIDNVRRGAELVGGQGRAAPDFTFATIYRLRKWAHRRLLPVLKRGKFLSGPENPAELFR